jgi:hypothetical protein
MEERLIYLYARYIMEETIVLVDDVGVKEDNHTVENIVKVRNTD